MFAHFDMFLSNIFDSIFSKIDKNVRNKDLKSFIIMMWVTGSEYTAHFFRILIWGPHNNENPTWIFPNTFFFFFLRIQILFAKKINAD